jgi:hypothetical protein
MNSLFCSYNSYMDHTYVNYAVVPMLFLQNDMVLVNALSCCLL